MKRSAVGWIDGIRKNVDETSYTIRFTRRKTGSIWSAINIKRRRRADRAGQNEACRDCRPSRTGRKIGRGATRTSKQARSSTVTMRRDCGPIPRPGRFSRRSRPGYQKTCCWWVASAKKEETRLRRLES